MAFDDEMGQMFGSRFQGQQIAASSLPDSLKAMFVPLMESLVANAQRGNDPISRLGDVGSALFESAGSGTPFAKNLAALDTQKTQATQGAANMFLQIFGMDRQLEESRAQERRFLAGQELEKQRLEETRRQHGETTRLAEARGNREERRLDITETAEARREKAEARNAFNSTFRAGLPTAGDSSKLEPRGSAMLTERLRNDPQYKMAWETNDAKLALERYGRHYEEVAKDPNNVKLDTGAPGMAKLQRALAQAKTPEERAQIQAEIDGELAKTEKAQLDARRVKGEAQSAERAAKTVEDVAKKLIKPDGSVNRDLLTTLWANAPLSEGRELRKQLQIALYDYIYAKSGKQTAVAELDRWITTYMPSVGDTDAGVKQKLKSLQKNMETLFSEGPKIETRGPGYEIQAPPGFRPTGRTTKDGRPIYTDGVNDIAPPVR